MVRPAGLEPTTSGSVGRCSIQLSHGRTSPKSIEEKDSRRNRARPRSPATRSACRLATPRPWVMLYGLGEPMIAENLFTSEGETGPVVLSFAAPTGGLGHDPPRRQPRHPARQERTQRSRGGPGLDGGHPAISPSAFSTPERHLGQVLQKGPSPSRTPSSPRRSTTSPLLAGYPESPEVANMAYLSKQKLIADLRGMAYDYILIDAGSGTGADTLDFFLAGITPSPSSRPRPWASSPSTGSSAPPSTASSWRDSTRSATRPSPRASTPALP